MNSQVLFITSLFIVLTSANVVLASEKTYCGWKNCSTVSHGCEIVDEKFDVIIIMPDFSRFSEPGPYTKISKKDKNLIDANDCFCVRGKTGIAPWPGPDKRLFFEYVSSVKSKENTECAQGDQLKNKLIEKGADTAKKLSHGFGN